MSETQALPESLPRASGPPPGSARPALRGARSFTWHLTALLLGVLLPALAIIALLLVQYAASERAKAEGEARSLARVLAIALDREVEIVATTMQALSTAPSLSRGDLAEFHAQALRVRDRQGFNISVRDAEGALLATTRLPLGTPDLPPVPGGVRQADARAAELGRPYLSDTFEGPITRQPAVQVTAPVVEPDGVRLFVGASLDLAFFQRILTRFDRPPGWSAVIIDRNFVRVARDPGFAAYAGRPATQTFRDGAARGDGIYYGATVDGVESLVAFRTSSATGWRVVVALPVAEIDTALQRSLLTLAASGGGLGALGLGLAVAMRRRLSSAVERVADLAASIREGRRAELGAVGVTEIARIGQTLNDAADGLRESEARLRGILDNLFAFVGLLDLDGRVLEANQAPLRLIGATRSDVLGRPVWDCPWWQGLPEAQARVKAACEAAARGESSRFDLEVRTRDPDGSITIDFQMAPLRDAAGRIVALQPSGVDITDRVRAQAELARREARSRFLADLYARLDPEEDPQAVLRTAATALVGHLGVDGAAVYEIDAEADRATIHMASWPGPLGSGVKPYSEVFAEATRAALAEGRVVKIPDVRTHGLTASRAAWFEGAGIRSCLLAPLVRRGRLVGAFVMVHGAPYDWTGTGELVQLVAERVWGVFDRTRLVRDLGRSEERLRGFATSNVIGMIYGDIRGGVHFANDEFLRIVGHARADLDAGRLDWAALTPPEWRDADARGVAEARERGACTPYEKEYLRADGRRVPVLVGYSLAEPEREQSVAFILDLTEPKRVAAELATTAERLALSQEAAGVASWEWHPETDRIAWTAEGGRLFGVPDDPVPTLAAVITRIHPEDRPAVQAEIAATLADPARPYDVEFRVEDGAGGWRWLMGRGRALRDGSGRVLRLAGVNMDITGRRELEERQRFLIRELHHRVKNTLATVQAIAGATMRSSAGMEAFRERFGERLMSLGRSHSLLTDNAWERAALRDLIRLELEPYGLEARVTLEGPEVDLGPALAVPIGMGLHELATNAAKHGSLSVPDGRVSVAWRVEQGHLVIDWVESGGPPVSEPRRQGFGSRLLSRVLGQQINGRTAIAYEPGGLRVRIDAPLDPAAAVSP